ncbi:unannotated protein [freshwater metagenome]|uniref:Unannotated protein n=1 Tax=freshwater metagenome TaxID=449393 RepID=A0A6J6QTI5_9ZZZZ
MNLALIVRITFYLLHYFLLCALIAASRADFKRFCALSYAAKSPFASAARPSAYACFALANEFASEEFVVVPPVVVPPVVPPAAVPEFPPNT